MRMVMRFMRGDRRLQGFVLLDVELGSNLIRESYRS